MGPLSYQSDSKPRSFRKRIGVGLVCALCFSSAVYIFARKYPSVTSQIKLRNAVSECLISTQQPDEVVFATEPETVRRLLLDAQAYRRDSLYGAAFLRTPAWEQVARSMNMMDCPPLIFGRVGRNGIKKIVTVHSAASSNLESGDCMLLLLVVTEPGGAMEKPRVLWRSVEGTDTFLVPKGQFLTIMGATPDPNDGASLVARYKCGSESGSIRLSLLPDDTARIQIESGPLLPPHDANTEKSN